ncbi:MAG: 2-C-methyl-D-erythritol 2,4-cyclodiphosphate synthase [Bacteroidetes bacterium]|nr:MAG: 2-C-methyl-D-erythritol 2,4-cyclodiphosphate synthase [Bacteroidota bacterium]
MVRVGIGYDVHRLVKGRDLVLGGVTIPNDLGLEGHSDADVLLHAIIDALLGAAALGDIGTHFPDTDAEFKGVSSLKLLAVVHHLLRDAGCRVQNIDSTLALEAPKLNPHIQQMCANVASVLELDPSSVSIKATTSERLGFVGSKEGAAAYAICTIDDGK